MVRLAEPSPKTPRNAARMQGQGCEEVFGMFLVTRCALGSIDRQAMADGQLGHVVTSFDEATDHAENEHLKSR